MKRGSAQGDDAGNLRDFGEQAWPTALERRRDRLRGLSTSVAVLPFPSLVRLLKIVEEPLERSSSRSRWTAENAVADSKL
jgi:hypothetical protein